jgi:hypothetical protein
MFLILPMHDLKLLLLDRAIALTPLQSQLEDQQTTAGQDHPTQ